MPTKLYRTGDRNAGPRWQEFWNDAGRKELGNIAKRNTAEHPMRGLMANDGKTVSMLEYTTAKSLSLIYRKFEMLRRRYPTNH